MSKYADLASDKTTLLAGSAQLQWRENGTPYSSQFDDIYFSKDSGIDESHYVFIEQNHLPERWQALEDSQACTFTIFETGFGTGLNFLNSCKCWWENAPENARLHFISIEKYPLSKAELQQALAHWPELSPFSNRLIEYYPDYHSGVHRLRIPLSKGHQDASLTLIFDDIANAWSHIFEPDYGRQSLLTNAAIDAWFLDGFAPAKNPDMWSADLFKHMRLLSKENTTVATFTAVGNVRRSLIEQGFNMEKVTGFGSKREMLKGQMPAMPEFDPAQPAPAKKLPWHLNHCHKSNDSQSAIVIGGGLAGCSTARALINQGWQVTLIERHSQLAAEASGNPAGILFTRLSPEQNLLGEFNLQSLHFAQRFYRQLQQRNSETESFSHTCGVLQLAYNEKQRALFKKLEKRFNHHDQWLDFLNAEEASKVANISIEHPALYFKHSGWLSPSGVCKALVDQQNNLQLLTNTEALSLHYDDKQWYVLNKAQQTIANADLVVIANANDAAQFEQTRWLPVKPIRGQVSVTDTTDKSSSLQTVICHEGYITPSFCGQHCIGASYDFHNTDVTSQAADNQSNLNSLNTSIPSLKGLTVQADRAALRCTTPDYLPIVGLAPKRDNFIRNNAELKHNGKAAINPVQDYYPQLFINIGHGSRGLTYTPLCAELIACYAAQSFLPLSYPISKALAPARFLLRGLIRNQV